VPLAGAAAEDVFVDEGCLSDLASSNDGEPVVVHCALVM